MEVMSMVDNITKPQTFGQTFGPCVTKYELGVFGSYDYRDSISEKKVLNGLRLENSKEQLAMKFTGMCKQILEDECHLINRVHLERLLLQLSDNYDNITDALLDAFNTVTNNYYNYIQDCINN